MLLLPVSICKADVLLALSAVAASSTWEAFLRIDDPQNETLELPFYAKAGDNLKATAAAVFSGAPPSEDKQFGPMVAIFDSSGTMVQQDDDGGGTPTIPCTAVSNYAVTESGFTRSTAATKFPSLSHVHRHHWSVNSH